MKKREKRALVLFSVSVILLLSYFISILPVISVSKRKIEFCLPNDIYTNTGEIDMKDFTLYDILEDGNMRRYYYKNKNQKLTVVFNCGKIEKINLISEKYIYTFTGNTVNVIDEKSKNIFHFKDGKFIGFSVVSSAKYLGKSVYVITYYNIDAKRTGVKIMPKQYNENNKIQNFFFVKYFNAVFAQTSEFDFFYEVDNR